ncbi:MAG: IS110 family transposase [Actinobacteria bacterium]|nr:IS110 family transposase [Actinomycetota bacterium]
MGCDVHLDTIAAAVVDGTGAEIEGVTVPNTVTGWEQLTGLVADYQIGTVGIEGASGFGRRFAATLVAADIEVREVPTRLTARQRRTDGAGKTDPGDARTIARATARGQGSRWTNDDTLETVRVLHVRREHLVNTQTADINQLRALIVELDPAIASELKRLRSARDFRTLTTFEFPTNTRHQSTVVGLIRSIAQDCLDRLDQIRLLERQLETVMPPAGNALIATLTGCSTVTAARILAEIAGTDRFGTDAKMAAWAGTAPLDASSGRQQRHRLNRGGNRQVNRALHTIIVTQTRHGGEAAHYLTRRLHEGKTRREAIRAAKRHLTRRIWKILHTHQLT